MAGRTTVALGRPGDVLRGGIPAPEELTTLNAIVATLNAVVATSGRAVRRSRLFDDGSRLLYGDLHNHSLLSDGSGNPEAAFLQLRAAGLDVAALTDHSSIPPHLLPELGLAQYPDHNAVAIARCAPHSIDGAGWERVARIADSIDRPGDFTALRGFEWTEPWLGHINVWFSDRLLAVTRPGTLAGLHSWLGEEDQALFGYNHPGREPGRLGGFSGPPSPDLARRMVTLEVFNRYDDFLFAGHALGQPSPVVAVLDSGWRPGLIGSSDEHGRSYALPGKGRCGLWAYSHSRPGIREALLARRTFATRELELHLDLTLDGVRMGGTVPTPASSTRAGGTAPGSHRHQVAVDLSGDDDGEQAVVQFLVSDGSGAVVVGAEHLLRMGEVARFELDLPSSPWVVARVGDPRRVDELAPPGHPVSSWALGYASPWWLDRV